MAPYFFGSVEKTVLPTDQWDYPFFKNMVLLYGGSPLFYTILVLLPILLSPIIFFLRGGIPFYLAVGSYYLILLTNPLLSYLGPVHAARFAVPVVYASILLMLCTLIRRSKYGFLGLLPLFGLFLFWDNSQGHTLLFKNRTLLQIVSGQNHIAEPYFRGIYSVEYQQYIESVLGALPTGSSVAVLAGNTVAVKNSPITVYPVDFTGFLSPGFSMEGMDYFVWEVGVGDQAYKNLLSLKDYTDSLSQRSYKGALKHLFPLMDKPVFLRTDHFVIYQLN
jgi:hypothetical protein